ncbi:MAG: polymerase sigma-B factor [Mycobacteriales bacterium]|jgi:RNA polymerase sigma-B factor
MSAPQLVGDFVHRSVHRASPVVADGTDRSRARGLFQELADLRAAGSPCPIREQRLRDELVRMHLPLVRFHARRYANRGEPLDDLIQAGSVGLVKAMDRFDPGRGLEFSTYASPTILGEIRRHFRDRTWAVHVNRGLQELVSLVTRARAELTAALGRSPTVAETASHIERSEEDVLTALDCAAAYHTQSFEVGVGDDRTLGDTLGTRDQALDDVDLHESLRPLVARLPTREQRILQLRFYGNRTQSQIAAELGISQMHVSRLLARTLARLRVQLLADG